MTETKKTNDISKPSSARSESNSARRESSQKTLISDHELERSVYIPNVGNMRGINILWNTNETQTSFEYLKNNLDKFFLGYPDIFDSDLKEFFKDIPFE